MSKKRIRTFTPQALAKKKFVTHAFDGKFKDLIGIPEVGFNIIIFGKPKAGKSTFCMYFAQYLSRFGKVLYNSTEEGPGVALQKRAARCNVKSKKVLFTRICDYETLVELLDRRASPKFIFIDSVQKMSLTIKQFDELKDRYPKKSFILILQSKRNGDFKGTQSWVHDTDVKISVDSGIASSQGRFNSNGKYRIFDDPVITFHKKSIATYGKR